jgi:hypothetical protein
LAGWLPVCLNQQAMEAACLWTWPAGCWIITDSITICLMKLLITVNTWNPHDYYIYTYTWVYIYNYMCI